MNALSISETTLLLLILVAAFAASAGGETTNATLERTPKLCMYALPFHGDLLLLYSYLS